MYDEMLTAHKALRETADQSTLRTKALETELRIANDRLKDSLTSGELLAIENRRLQAEAAQMKKTLEIGISQYQLINEAKLQRYQDELQRTQQVLKFIQEQKTLTEDVVIRNRAARAYELEVQDVHKSQRILDLEQQVRALQVDQRQLHILQAANAVLVQAVSRQASIDPSHSPANVLGPAGPVLQDLAEPADLSLNAIIDESQNAFLADESVPPAAVLVPSRIEAVSAVAKILVNTTGETTEITTVSERVNSDIASASQDGLVTTDSQGKSSAMSTDQILELDSAILESPYAYVCEWGTSKGAACGEQLASQLDLYKHIEETHVGL